MIDGCHILRSQHLFTCKFLSLLIVSCENQNGCKRKKSRNGVNCNSLSWSQFINSESYYQHMSHTSFIFSALCWELTGIYWLHKHWRSELRCFSSEPVNWQGAGMPKHPRTAGCFLSVTLKSLARCNVREAQALCVPWSPAPPEAEPLAQPGPHATRPSH